MNSWHNRTNYGSLSIVEKVIYSVWAIFAIRNISCYTLSLYVAYFLDWRKYQKNIYAHLYSESGRTLSWLLYNRRMSRIICLVGVRLLMHENVRLLFHRLKNSFQLAKVYVRIRSIYCKWQPSSIYERECNTAKAALMNNLRIMHDDEEEEELGSNLYPDLSWCRRCRLTSNLYNPDLKILSGAWIKAVT